MSNMNAIELKGLTKTYGNRHAIDHLDLTILSGCIFGFLGPNGAGKTTTIRILLGLISATSGEAFINGHNIASERHAVSSQVGAIIESPRFYDYMSARDNLQTLALTSNYDLAKSKIDELLDFVGLSDRSRCVVSSYSFGMKQRLGIAATLLHNPSVIFLDEPTNGLDPAGCIEVQGLIKRLGAEGYTVFLTSHLLKEIEAVCTRVAIIKHGKKIVDDEISTLLSGSNEVELELRPLQQAHKLLEGLNGVQVRRGDGDKLILSCAASDIPQVVKKLVMAGIDVFSVHKRQQTLEALFLNITA